MNEKPDAEGRAAWRASVGAFRAAAAVLNRPAPYAMSLLSEVAVVASLAAEPSITSFSPFEALPTGDYAARDETSEGDGGRVRAAKYVEATRGVETARGVLDARPSRPVPARREQTTRASESGAGSEALPAFSLRPPRSRAAGTKPADAPPRARRESSSLDARRDEAGAARADTLETRRLILGPRETDAAVPTTPLTRESAVHGEPPTLPGVLRTKPPRAAGESEARAERHVQHPTAPPLLNDLADETLRALKLREGEAGHAANPPAVAPPARERRQPAELQPQSRTTTRRAEALTPATRAGARVSETPPSPRAPAPPGPGGERPAGIVGNSIEAINALAELLSARSAAPMTGRREAADDEGVASRGTPPVEETLTSDAYLSVAKPARGVEAAAPRDSSGPSLNAEGEAGATQALDAESVASLVNDVLVEQARRHGVDLS